MITKLGKIKLEEQLHELEQELQRTSEERGKAAAEGDLKENSAYIFLGERAEVLRSQIAQIKEDLKTSVVLPAPTQTETVGFGHRLKVRFEQDGREITITLVGKNDGRIKPDWISIESPIGIAVLGKKKLDKVIVNDNVVTIIDISVGEI